MYAIERKREILKLLSQHSTLRVSFLAKHLDASKETIRRDLTELQNEGLVERVHGGVTTIHGSPLSKTPNPDTLGESALYPQIKDSEIKRKLCQRAASYIESGDMVYVDNSSSTIFLPEYIPDNIDITLISNSIAFLTAAMKYQKPNITYICLGGILSARNLSTHGSMTVKDIEDYYPNKAFISCSGVSPIRSVTDSSIDEATVKKHMIDRSSEVFLLADHTKFRQYGQVFLAPVDRLNHVITDSISDDIDYTFLTDENVNIVTIE
jgi:DeoR family fructose operon transcriptional repressor